MNDESTQRLRDAFRLAPADSVAGEACPEPDDIWDAAHGCAPASLVCRVVDHTARCGACAEAWRLAHQFTLEADEVGPDRSTPQVDNIVALGASRGRSRARVWVGVAAAAAAAVLVWVIAPRPKPTEPERIQYRAPVQTVASPLTPVDGASVPRGDVVLTWSTELSGEYEVRVSTEDLKPVARSKTLTQPRFVIPGNALDGLAPGTKLVWQVVVVESNGTRTASAAHRFVLR